MNARTLHAESLVVDAHCDTVLDWVRGKRSFAEASTAGHIDLPRLREGGVDLQFFAQWIESSYKPERATARALTLIDAFYREMESVSSEVVVATRWSDIERGFTEGRLVALLSIEGGEPVQQDLGILRMFYRLGVRALGLTWNERNAIGDGVGDPRYNAGLTSFGVTLIQEMNRLGMLVDVSHLNEAGFWDVLAVSRSPIVATHSNARALCDHPRNLWDDQIKALAKQGGVMGMNFHRGFIDLDRSRVNIARLVDHIDHIVSLVGPDHVGLGSDFDGIEAPPEGLEDVRFMPRITEELVRRGYSEADIKKILGENFLRVLRAVLPA